MVEKHLLNANSVLNTLEIKKLLNYVTQEAKAEDQEFKASLNYIKRSSFRGRGMQNIIPFLTLMAEVTFQTGL